MYEPYWVSLAVDTQNRAHVVYADPIAENSRAHQVYAVQDGDGWSFTPLEITTAKPNAIVVDSADRPHIVYCDENATYARWSGGAWITQTLSSGCWTSVDIALDGEDHAHIALDADGLTYFYWDGVELHGEVVESGESVYALAVAVDSQNRPAIAYGFDFEARIAVRNGNGWDIEYVTDGAPRWCRSLDMLFDSRDVPHVGWCNGSGMIHAWREATSWQLELLDEGPCAVTQPQRSVRMAVTGDDRLLISSFQPMERDMALFYQAVLERETLLPIIARH
jgi:hypothetical protein